MRPCEGEPVCKKKVNGTERVQKLRATSFTLCVQTQTVRSGIEKCYEKTRFHETSQLKRLTQFLGKDHIKGIIFKLKIIVPNNIQIASINSRDKQTNRGTRKQRHKADLKPLSSQHTGLTHGAEWNQKDQNPTNISEGTVKAKKPQPYLNNKKKPVTVWES